MSLVTDIEYGNKKIKYKDILKLLKNPEEWKLLNKGEAYESFVHKDGWYFYTGLDICVFRKNENLNNIIIDCGVVQLFINKIRSTERKFIKKYLAFVGSNGS